MSNRTFCNEKTQFFTGQHSSHRPHVALRYWKPVGTIEKIKVLF